MFDPAQPRPGKAPHVDEVALHPPAQPSQPTRVQAEEPRAAYPFRLLADETVLATYPISSARRPLGRVASYLFVTDSRVIYAAESKTVLSSSTDQKQFRLDKVDGFEVGRHRGLHAVGFGVALGVLLNFGILAMLSTVLSSAPGGMLDDLGVLFTVLTVLAGIIGVIVVVNLLRPSVHLRVIGPTESQSLTEQHDWLTSGILFVLFLLLAPLLGIVLLAWWAARELGIFRAADAQQFSDSRNVDAISFHAGAVVLDAQARGTLAGR